MAKLHWWVLHFHTYVWYEIMKKCGKYIYWNIHWHLQTKLANHHVWTVFSTGSGWSCTSVRFTGPNVESEVLFLQLNIRDIGKGKTHEWNLGGKKKKNNLMFPKVNCWKKEKGAISIPRVIIPRVLSYCIWTSFFCFVKVLLLRITAIRKQCSCWLRRIQLLEGIAQC